MTTTGSLTITTPGDREVLITRELDAPKEVVFDAFTNPEMLRRWLYGWDGWSLDVCEIDLRVGGAIRYVWRKNEDSKNGPDCDEMVEMGLRGVFREVARPDRLVHTEIFDEDWTGGETLVTSVFSEKDGKTTVTMTIRYASKEARDMAIATPMAEGMEVGYRRLDKIFSESKGS